MRKALTIFYCFLILSVPLFSQKSKEDMLRDLKARVPRLSGKAKADALSNIAIGYIYSAIVRSDSGIVYIKKAYSLDESLQYKEGLCRDAGLYARVLLQMGLADDGLKYYQIMARAADELNDEARKAEGIRGMGQALWFQGNYQPAIDTILSSVLLFRQLRNYREISDAMLTISTIYGDQGNYEKAFENAQEALTLSEKYRDVANTILSLLQLGKLYQSIGDYTTASDYYRRGYKYKPARGDWTYRHLSHNMGDLHRDHHRYDSALYYYRESFAGNPGSRMSQLRMGQYYLHIANYDSAFFYFNMLYMLGDKSGEGNIRYSSMIGLSKVYLHKADYDRSLQFATAVLERAKIKNARLTLRDASEQLSNIYDALHQPAKALEYYKQYVQLKDDIISEQFKGKLYEFKRIAEDEKKLSQIKLLEKERQIAEQNLNETQILRNILMAAIVVLCILGAIIFWNISLKRKNEKLRNESSRAEWEKAATDLEMQALRAQMNPHFIFNCLSSINRFILKNEPEQASDYLTRFSRLIRMVLINSQRPLVYLEDELEMLRLYLGMEQLRFKDQFTYSITYSIDVKPSEIMVPPLLLQPFCENAIWHGLMHKEGPGRLCISFSMKEDVLHCAIIDDGIGRARAAEINSRGGEYRKSIGLKLTAERLALFNGDNPLQTSWTIDDVKNENGEVTGTQVILFIRHKELIEEKILTKL